MSEPIGMSGTELWERAEEAETATLWDEAARLYEESLSVLASTPERDGVDEAELLTALGRCYTRAGDQRSGWRTLRRAIAICRERGDFPAMGRATLEILRIWGPPERQQAMAEEALEALGDSEPHLRARILMRIWRPDEAAAVAEGHDFEDIRVWLRERTLWQAFEEGRTTDAAASLLQLHHDWVRLGNLDGAAGSLRNAGFMTMAFGDLDEGERHATAARDYARGVHLLFSEQLALLDLVGSAFARCDFERAESLCAETSGGPDFRIDLYRMWMAETRGDIARSLTLMVPPERGGGSPGATAQAHAGNAGILFAAGREDSARHELTGWQDMVQQDQNDLCDTVPALVRPLIALGSEGLLREVLDAFRAREMQQQSPVVYSTLQGRGLHAARGLIALRLGAPEEAERAFRAGLAWAERERCPLDEARCLEGLAAIEGDSGRVDEAARYRDSAVRLYRRHGALPDAERVAAR